MAAALIGFLRGNEFKLILQDARALSYYLLFFVVILLVNDRRLVLAFLRLLAFCVPVVFAIGAVYAALGQGMKLEYVEPGVSRFPAPDDVFLMSSVMTISFVTVWPPGRPRPRWLWGLLLLSLLGLVLSLVRGNWLAFAVAVLYLLVILRVRERMRLIALGVVAHRPPRRRPCRGAAGAAALGRLTGHGGDRHPATATSSGGSSRTARSVPRSRRAPGWATAWGRTTCSTGRGTGSLRTASRTSTTPTTGSSTGWGSWAWGCSCGSRIAFLLPWMKARATLPRDDPWLLGLVYGGRAMLVALLVVSITSPRLSEKLAVTVLGLVMGLSEVALSLLKRERRAEAETATQAVSAAASESG